MVDTHSCEIYLEVLDSAVEGTLNFPLSWFASFVRMDRESEQRLAKLYDIVDLFMRNIYHGGLIGSRILYVKYMFRLHSL